MLILQCSQGRRAVGVLLETTPLLNIDDAGRNVVKGPLAFLRVCLHVVAELERASVTEWLETHLTWERLLFQDMKLAVKSCVS